MPITLSCSCGRTLQAPDAFAGLRVRCPACAAVLAVPKPDAAPRPTDDAVEDPPRPRRRRSAKKAIQFWVYLVGGVLAILAGVGLFVGVTITREPGAGKVIAVGLGLVVFGVVSVIQALTGTMPDDKISREKGPGAGR